MDNKDQICQFDNLLNELKQILSKQDIFLNAKDDSFQEFGYEIENYCWKNFYEEFDKDCIGKKKRLFMQAEEFRDTSKSEIFWMAVDRLLQLCKNKFKFNKDDLDSIVNIENNILKFETKETEIIIEEELNKLRKKYSKDSNFSELERNIFAVYPNIKFKLFPFYRHKNLVNFMWFIIDNINITYAPTLGKAQVKSVVKIIEQFIKKIFPMDVFWNPIVRQNERNDYDIKSEYIIDSDNIIEEKRILYSRLLNLASCNGQFNIFMQLLKKYREYASEYDISHKILRMIEMTNGSDFYKDKIRELSYRDISRLMFYIELVQNKYSCNEIKNATKNIFKLVHFMINASSKDFLDKISLSQNTTKEEFSSRQKLLNKIKKWFENYDKDLKEYKNILKIQDEDDLANELWYYLVEYYNKYEIGVIADNYKNLQVEGFNEDQKYYLFCIMNEYKCVRATEQIIEFGSFKTTKEELIEQHNKNSYHNGNEIKNFKKFLEEICYEKDERTIKTLKMTGEGQEAIKNREIYVKRFLRNGLNVKDVKYSINDNDIDICYNKICKNKILTEDLAVAEMRNEEYMKIFKDDNGQGDYTFLNITFIKCVERYFKELNIQHYINSIYKTKDQGREITATLNVNANVRNTLTADDFSHMNNNLSWIPENSSNNRYNNRYNNRNYNGDPFNGIEIGPLYYSLKKNCEHLRYNEQPRIFDNNIFDRNFIQKVRNGFLHIEDISSIEEAEDNRNRTAYWFILAVIDFNGLTR